MTNHESLLRALAGIHVATQCALVLYGLHRLSMLVFWLRARRRSAPRLAPVCSSYPFVTVQLPIYNERFVAARLLDQVARLDWPRDRLEIQVLDDSTDDTRAILDQRAAFWRRAGLEVAVLRRETRRNYKAGALAHGMERARGEFLAIFDADFLPKSDFLQRVMPVFEDPRVGMAQARWEFINSEHSWLTRAQSVSLGAHFRLEHQVRHLRGLFFNFNGTAGVWRRRTIEEAGGWRADTVTEDLDLSYRAQLAGWRFHYLDEVDVPSELPVTLASLRAQQRRWAKGSVQTARKILPSVLTAPVPWPIKIESVFHLLGNLGWLFGMILLATLYPAILVHTGRDWRELVAIDLPLVLGSSGAFFLYFTAAAIAQRGRRGWRTAFLLPVVAFGMAPVVTLGLLEGLFLRGGCFHRTPKYGLLGKETLPRLAKLYHQTSPLGLSLNLLLALHGIVPVVLAIRSGAWAAVPILLPIPLAFGAYVVQELIELNRVHGRSTS